MRAEDFARRELDLVGWPLIVETYRLGDSYFATVSSAGAGARFSRAQGPSREEAERLALEKAEKWLGQTRRFPIGR